METMLNSKIEREIVLTKNPSFSGNKREDFFTLNPVEENTKANDKVNWFLNSNFGGNGDIKGGTAKCSIVAYEEFDGCDELHEWLLAFNGDYDVNEGNGDVKIELSIESLETLADTISKILEIYADNKENGIEVVNKMYALEFHEYCVNEFKEMLDWLFRELDMIRVSGYTPKYFYTFYKTDEDGNVIK